MHTTHDEVDLRLQVSQRTAGADDIVILDLRDPFGADLPAWSAGAHIDVNLGPDLVRQYSLCGDPGDPTVWRIAVLKEKAGRGGSARVHDELHEGVGVEVRGPRNNFAFEPAERYVFIAGGIGITPLLPMAAAAQEAGADWVLHYGGRTRSSMAFRDAIQERWGERVSIHPQDESGLLDLDTLLGDPQPGTLVYCCGPEPLLLAVEQRCKSWPAGALHVERFAPRQVGEPVLHDSFEIRLAKSGLSLVVPTDKSILEVIEQAGIQVLSSCHEGTCGTCETGLREGIADHRDSLLTAEEQAANDTMMICVSRAACPLLVLDL